MLDLLLSLLTLVGLLSAKNDTKKLREAVRGIPECRMRHQGCVRSSCLGRKRSIPQIDRSRVYVAGHQFRWTLALQIALLTNHVSAALHSSTV